MRFNVFPLLFIFIILSCAQKGMPPGGPVDRTPPVVISTFPQHEARNVGRDAVVNIEFSEGVLPNSIDAAVFITPYPGEGVKIKAGGRRLRIEFDKPLIDNRTYVVTLGTGIKDYRNNPLSKSFILAFATGAVLDTCEISGRIYGEENCSGIDVWAYMIQDTVTFDPSLREPDYAVQCAKDGAFRFTHLATAKYRLLAVQDKLADRLYQPVEDRYGITFQDVNLSEKEGTVSEAHYFRLTRADTAGPRLTKAVIVNPRSIILNFDQPISTRVPIYPDSVQIRSADDMIIRVDTLYPDPRDTRKIHVLTDEALADGKFSITVCGVQDEAGNEIDTTGSRVIAGWKAETDTVRPGIVEVKPQPGIKTVSEREEFHFYFSEPVSSENIRESIVLSDTLGNVFTGLSGLVSPLEAVFQPGNPLPGKMYFQIELKGSFFKDYAGNLSADSVFNFQVINPDTFSAILGEVNTSDTLSIGDIYISARSLERGGSTYHISITESGEFSFLNILPGLYVLEAFQDSNGDGIYSHGSIMPYQTAERFTVYPDTLKIRSRWPNEGHNLSIK